MPNVLLVTSAFVLMHLFKVGTSVPFAKSSFMDLAVNLMVMKVILLTVTVVLIAVLIQSVLQLQPTFLLHLPIINLLLNNLLL
jgi:hypothetical protein